MRSARSRGWRSMAKWVVDCSGESARPCPIRGLLCGQSGGQQPSAGSQSTREHPLFCKCIYNITRTGGGGPRALRGHWPVNAFFFLFFSFFFFFAHSPLTG